MWLWGLAGLSEADSHPMAARQWLGLESPDGFLTHMCDAEAENTQITGASGLQRCVSRRDSQVEARSPFITASLTPHAVHRGGPDGGVHVG